jgi:hypothetical protein
MTAPRFERAPGDTHCLMYGTPDGGELLVTYWPTRADADLEMFEVLDMGATSARVYTLDDLDRIESGTAHRDDRCRYCHRYGTACGRDHSDETRRDWGRDWVGNPAPACAGHTWRPVQRGTWHCAKCGAFRHET